ncbi:MAG: DUF5050 domain-containing protein [Roseburia sp.]|nr:DUF5050 domain-containing protein [Roseburia sp.]
MKRKIIIPVVILVVLIASISLFRHWHNRFHYNDNYVNGNTAGNLYNGGLFCESNGTVFFSNPDDKGRLYAMDANGSNLRKLCGDTAMYINADDHYIYYVRNNSRSDEDFSVFSYNNNSLCRIPRDGGDSVVLDEAPCIYASLLGNYIYYLHYDDKQATTLYRVKIDGTESAQIYPYYVFNCSTIGQYFYYNGTQKDSNIYQYDTASQSSSVVFQCDAYKPIAESTSSIYYMDVANNYALTHANTSSGSSDIVTNDSIDCYNLYGSTLIYQKYSETDPALCVINTDGTGYKEIAAGNYTNICVTSYYIYFKDFKTGQTYYTSTSNPGEIHEFTPGMIITKS